MSDTDIRWNDEARAKILNDSDRVLSEAVLDLGPTFAGRPWEDAFAELNARLKDRFIDFEPGPDLRKYAEGIAAGDYSGSGADAAEPGTEAGSSSDTGSSSTDAQGTSLVEGESSSAGESGLAAGSDDTAPAPAGSPAGSAEGNGAGDGEGAFAPDADTSEENTVVNDG